MRKRKNREDSSGDSSPAWEKITKKYDIVDEDDRLDGVMAALRARGAIVIPPVESVARLEKPLSDETLANFGDIALAFLENPDCRAMYERPGEW